MDLGLDDAIYIGRINERWNETIKEWVKNIIDWQSTGLSNRDYRGNEVEETEFDDWTWV